MRKLTPVLMGYGVRLRPVAIDDAEFILELRNMPHVKGKMGDLKISLDEEKAWLKNNIQNPNDYFFIVESISAVKLGTFGVYDIDMKHRIAEIGRLVIIPGSMSFLPARILLNDFCFNTLGLDVLTACVVSTNRKVLSYNEKLGAEITHIAHNERIIASSPVDMVYLKLTKETWKKKRESLIQLAEQAASFQKK